MAKCWSAAERRFAPGLSTCVVRPSRFEPAEHLPLIAQAGFACIELCVFFGSNDFGWDQPRTIDELKRVAADTKVRIDSVHAAAGLGCFRMGHGHALAMDLLKAHADLAAELGACVVPMHAGPTPDEPRADAIRRLRCELDELANHARGLPCRFGWENEPKRLTTDEHLAWLRDLDPASFGFLLDPGHGNMAGTLDRYLDQAGDLLCGLHLNDNDGVGDLHQLPGKGTINWSGFMSRLETTGFAGPLMLEVLASPDQPLTEALAEARGAATAVRSS